MPHVRMVTAQPNPFPEPAGLAARQVAAEILDNVLRRHRPLDEQLDGAAVHPALTKLAVSVAGYKATSSDAARVQLLHDAITGLAGGTK